MILRLPEFLRIKAIGGLPQVLMLGLVLFSFNGCSLGMFGDGQDSSVRDSTGYREINNSCSAIELPSAELDIASFRGLLRCFNSNGALDPLDRLVSALSDERVDPIVKTVNRSILKNKTLLYQLESTHQTLIDRGLLDSTLQQLGRLTENEEFIASAIALLKEGYFSGSGDRSSSRQPDKLLLKALKRISSRLSQKNTEDVLDAALNLGTSRSFQELHRRLGQENPSGRSLREITDGVLEHLRDFNDPDHVQVGRELIGALINGDLFKTFDEVVGTSEEDLRRGIPRLSAVLRVALANDGHLFKGLTSLFHYARKPLSCVSGGATVADPAFFILNELAGVAPENAASFLKRDNLLNLAAMNPFCSFPAELASGYPMLMAFADTNAIRPTTEMIQAFHRIERDGDRPMARLLINLLADTGSGNYPGAPDENTSGIKRLTPLLAEITDREAWDDTLLVANLIDFEHRKNFIEFLKFVTEPATELDGKSVYEVLTDVILRTRSTDFYNFVHSMRRFTSDDKPILAPALKSLRSAYYSNDVHPVFDLARQILSEAPENDSFFSTLFVISEMPEFRESLRLISTMAKDGRLKTLTGALLAVFHKSAQEGASEIRETSEPEFQPKRRHNLSSADLTPFQLEPEPTSANPACLRIDLGVNLGETSGPDFETQLRNISDCLNSSGNHADVDTALNFLTHEKMSDGRSALAYQIDLIRKLRLTDAEARVAIQAWIREYDQGRFAQLLKAVPFWLSPKPDPALPAVSQLLLKGIAPLVPGELPKLDHLGQFGAGVLRKSEFPRLLGYLDHLWSADDGEEEKHKALAQPEDRLDEIAQAVTATECVADSADALERAKEIVHDYRQSVTSWDLVNGRQRTGWKKDEFRKKAERITGKLADPAQSLSSKTLITSLLDFMRRYSLKKGEAPSAERQHEPEHLARWLKDRSEDHQLVPYYFPDERGRPKRRVRLLNSLDRFELVLINSDFKAPIIGKNFGMQFLAQIAEAWGDEPDRNLWPAEIQRKYPNGKRPKTLREAFKEIARTQRIFEFVMRFPKSQSCDGKLMEEPIEPTPAELAEAQQALNLAGPFSAQTRRNIQVSLYNIRQVLSVIEENLPGSGHPKFDGGLKVFRDLFYHVYYSTPQEFRGARDGDANNLSLIMWIARMGGARQIGRLFFSSEATEPDLKLFFEGFVRAAVARGTDEALRAILSQPKHALLWNAVEPLIELQDVETIRNLRSAAFHAVLTGEQLNLIPKAMALAPAILNAHRETLTQHIGWATDALQSKKLTAFLEKFYKNQDLDRKGDLRDLLHEALDDPELAHAGLSVLDAITAAPEARQAWGDAWDRLQSLKKHPEYPHEALNSLLRDLTDFFAEASGEAASAEAAAKFRVYLADRLESGDFLPLLELAAGNPAEFHQVLKTFSRHLENGDLQEFFALIRRGLSDGERTR